MTEVVHALTKGAERLSEKAVPHDLKETRFIRPTWCDNCAGLLVGKGFECIRCNLRIHVGGGDNVENCRAEFCLTECVQGAQHKQGTYKFGDLTKQLGRNAHQKVKDTVVQAVIQEQKDWGKFDKLKAYVDELRAWWDDSNITWYVMFAETGFAVGGWLLGYMSVLLLHSGDNTWAVARLQGLTFVAVVLWHWILLAGLVHLLGRGLLKYSALVHTFVHEVLQVELATVDIDLDVFGNALSTVSFNVLTLTVVMWIAVVSVWAGAIRNA